MRWFAWFSSFDKKQARMNELKKFFQDSMDDIAMKNNELQQENKNEILQLKESVKSVSAKLDQLLTQGSMKKDHEKKNGNSYIRLMELCSKLIEDDIDSLEGRVCSEETKDFLCFMRGRVMDAMLLSGGTFIDEDTEFDILRHEPVPMGIVKDGTPIEEIITPGMAMGNRVFVKAKVRI